MRYFAPFRFDERDRALWRGQETVRLTRKARDLLACLLAAQGRCVSKADILATVWPDTHVHPDNIKVLVREIRSALGDDAQQPRFVRSEAGRGYAFVADTASPSRSLSDAAAEAPLFLCRNAQLRAFGEAFDAVRAGSSRVLLVSGERGAGKSALCDAFLRSAGVATVLRVGTGQCPDAPAEGLLAPLLDALANLAQQYRSLVPRVLAEEAPAWFARFPEWAEEPTPAAADTDALVEQLTRALATLSKDAVTILVLEDLQWADRATLQILARLAGRSWPARWLVVATACPYSLTPEGPILDSLADAMRAADPALVVDVGSFACDQIERYLDARFGAGCLTDLAPALHELTAGNPLLFVTLADGLVARGLVRAGPMTWHRSAPSEDLESLLAHVLRHVIVLQIDRLCAPEREILESAAAIGLEFTAEAASLASGVARAHAARLLDGLARRRVMIQAVAPAGDRQPGGTGYRFRHAACAEALFERASILQRVVAARQHDGVHGSRLERTRH